MTSRISLIASFIKAEIPTWDLCCDHGMIGLSVLASNLPQPVFFVDQQPHIVSQLNSKLKEFGIDQSRFQVLCEDILTLCLPEKPCNFIIAGVGTNLIISFLARFNSRVGHRIICHTDQNPERFEHLLSKTGMTWTCKESVLEKKVLHHIWVLDF